MFDVKNCFGNTAAEERRQTSKTGIKGLYKGLPVFSEFCTPGHKGTLIKEDVTEWKGGEIFPQGAIEYSQTVAANFYNVQEIRFLVCGASMGVKAAVMAVGGDVIAPRFSHKCLFQGATLTNARAYTFDTGIGEDGLPSIPTAADYERECKKHSNAKALFVTSPDYFGRVADVNAISRVAKKYGKLLIADCAHGAHFASRPDLFPLGAERIADFAVLSAHKTLRALTQSAIGVVNAVDYMDRYDEALALLGTTSPSYTLLASLESAIEYEKEKGDDYDALVDACNKIRKEFSCLSNDDPLRLVIKTENAERTFDALVSSGIMPETYYGNYCIFIVTLSDTPEKVEKLADILRRIESR